VLVCYFSNHFKEVEWKRYTLDGGKFMSLSFIKNYKVFFLSLRRKSKKWCSLWMGANARSIWF